MRGAKQGEFHALQRFTLRHYEGSKTKVDSEENGPTAWEYGFDTLDLRFADDVLLVSSTLPRLVEMRRGGAIAPKTRGLELHPDKTKIISSLAKRRGRGNTSHAQDLDVCIQILPFFT